MENDLLESICQSIAVELGFSGPPVFGFARNSLFALYLRRQLSGSNSVWKNASFYRSFLFCQLHRLLSFLLSVKMRLAGEQLCRESHRQTHQD